MKRLISFVAAAACLTAPGLAAADATPPRLLVYSGTAGFHHISIDHANAVLARLAKFTGAYTATFIDKPAQLTPERLADADIVMWQNTTGSTSPFTDAQEQAYVKWLGCGGGHIGIHAAADSWHDDSWKEWTEIQGAFFKIHPLTATSIYDDQTPQTEGWGEPEVTINIVDKTSPITAPWRGQDSYKQNDEIYALDRDPATTIADFHPLLAFGGFTDPVLDNTFHPLFYGDNQPLAWRGSFRHKNRLYYTNIGHSVLDWDRIDFQDSLLAAIDWVSGLRPDAGCLTAAEIGA